MLRITMELVPQGDESKAKVLASGTITNLGGQASDKLGDYKYKLKKQRGRIWREGELKGFPRQSRGVWTLLFVILCKEFLEYIPDKTKWKATG